MYTLPTIRLFLKQLLCFHRYNKTGGNFYFWGNPDVQFRLQRCPKCGKQRIIRLERIIP